MPGAVAIGESRLTAKRTDVVRDSFPQAVPVSEARDRLLHQLEEVFGADRRTTLLATSLCADALASVDIGRDLPGPFTLGGLAGLPFTGRTAMSAYAGHIPDNGTAMIIYGPHIGTTREGTLGRLIRPGHSRETTSCGALMAALERMSGGDEWFRNVPSAGDDDQQQRFLERSLTPFKTRILAAESPQKEITDVTYSLIHDQVHRLLDTTRDQFGAVRIVFAGGVIINTDPNEEDWFELRHLGSIDPRRGGSVGGHPPGGSEREV